jgi:hypothetical protein
VGKIPHSPRAVARLPRANAQLHCKSSQGDSIAKDRWCTHKAGVLCAKLNMENTEVPIRMRSFFSFSHRDCLGILLIVSAAVLGQEKSGAVQNVPALTANEKSWIAAHPVIRIQMSDSSPPFEFRENKKWKGMAYDYLVESCRRAGLRLEVVEIH